ncbi:MAG: FliH/SctL family protein [Phycisphaerales bacterium]|nr:hypothetical protein [Planctomycetota bacterium]
MALIRQTERSTPLADAIVYRLGDLVREGAILRESTQREVHRMLDEARAERDRLIATAREEGLAAGREEGLRQGLAQGREQGRNESLQAHKQELDTLLKGWNESLASFDSARDALLLEARTEVLRLAAQIATAVLKKEVEFRPETVVDQATAALAMVTQPSTVRLRINPEDRETIDRALPGLLARCTGARHIDIDTDPAITRGSCIVRSAGGEIDARLDVQLARIVQAVVPPRDPPVSPPPSSSAAPDSQP